MPLQNPSAMEGDVCSECNETITKKTCGHARKCMYCEKAICKSCKRKCQNDTWIKAKKKMWIHIECQKRMHRELTCVDCNTLSKNLGTIRQCVLCGDSYCKKHKKKHMEKTGAKTYVDISLSSSSSLSSLQQQQQIVQRQSMMY